MCESIGPHPNIASNLTAAWVEERWWVIDRWDEGPTLAERIAEGPLPRPLLKKVMRGVAEGLLTLHGQKMVRRELTPKHIVLAERDRAVLTDFELAKLLEGGPTVSPAEWPDDPYRAPEVSGETTVTPAADVYSWGRIFADAVLGGLPDRGKEESSLKNAELPESLTRAIGTATKLRPSQRTVGLVELAVAVGSW